MYHLDLNKLNHQKLTYELENECNIILIYLLHNGDLFFSFGDYLQSL